MPVGKVRFYDAEKGFGFLTKDEGGDVYVRATALPPGVTALKAGQKVEFGVVEGRKGEQAQGALFAAPAVLLLSIGLVYPAVLTIIQSVRGKSGEGSFSLENYVAMFTQPELLLVLRNTALWVILVPFLATAIGLLYAILIDRARGEAFAKALIFLPMAISFVGASIIWRFMYQPRNVQDQQTGVLNAIWVGLGKLSNSGWQKWLVAVVLAAIILFLIYIAWKAALIGENTRAGGITRPGIGVSPSRSRALWVM